MKKIFKYLSFIMMLTLVFSITSISKVSADTTEINLLPYRVDYDDRDGLVNWQSIPVSSSELFIRIVEDPGSFYLLNGSISFNNSGGSIDLTTYTSNELYNGIYVDVPVGSTEFNMWYQTNLTDQDFYYVYIHTHVYEVVEDTTPPVINGGIYFANVDSPVTMNDVLATLTATDETDGDLTASIINTADNYTSNSSVLGDYITTWEVSDSSGNTTTVDITVRVVDITKPITTLNGDSVVYVEYLDTYIDDGATCSDNYDVSCSVDLITNEVNTSILGAYEVSYDATDSSGNVSTDAIRTVYVQDTTNPVITLNGDSTVYIEFGDSYTELGAVWTDNYDISGNAVITGSVNDNILGSYTLEYNYTDSNGNVASTVTRTVIVQDTTDPVITLNGDSTVYIEFGDNYTELGATFTDTFDGNGSANISGSVDINTLGSYILEYNYTDSSGNVASTVTRTVIVQDTTAPSLYINNIITYNSQNATLTELLSLMESNDLYDGNIKANVIITLDEYTGNETNVGVYNLSLSITDSSGNNTVKSITITVLDDIAPIITLDSYLLTEEEANNMTQAEIIAHMQTQP